MDCSTPDLSVHHQLMSIESVMPSNHLILCHPLLFPPSIFPGIRVFSNGQFFTSGGQSIGVSSSASVLPMNIQDWFPLGWTGWISLSPRDSQESSPTPQFKSINSSVFSHLRFYLSRALSFFWRVSRRLCAAAPSGVHLSLASWAPMVATQLLASGWPMMLWDGKLRKEFFVQGELVK